VCQGCHCSPALFNIYLGEIITNRQKEVIKGLPLPKIQQLATLLFADDQVVISNTEENLQRAAYKLKQIITVNNHICTENKTGGS